jgi:hypothetical protein
MLGILAPSETRTYRAGGEGRPGVRDASAMAALLLPVWVRVLGAVVLLVVTAVLARRAALATGPQRLWHAGYAGVAVAMALMFAANPMVGPGPSWSAWIVLVGAALALVALTAFMVLHRRSAGLTPPWIVAWVDLVILGYIQVPSPSRPIVVCTLFAAYLAVQVVARAVAAARARRRPAPARSLVGAAGGPDPAASEHASARPDDAGGDLRGGADTMVALSVLALSMLYMISI